MNYPLSTYRIQLNSAFTFKELSAVIDYLHLLGISTIYAAPITASVKDSLHGYDVTDFSVLNPQIGTVEELQQIAGKLKQYGMTWLQDIVPNHMAFSPDNLRLTDVLERGERSPYSGYFDIDWNHPSSPQKLMIPELKKELDECIESNELKIICTGEGIKICYGDRQYPFSIHALNTLIQYMKKNEFSAGLSHYMEEYERSAEENDLMKWTTRKNELLSKLFSEQPGMVKDFFEALNQDKEALKIILYQQSYILTYWKNSETSMNYRRFFAVNSLISLRMEDEKVFNDYHAFLFALYKQDLIQGFRLDHIDGLYDPLAYIRRLRALAGEDCYIIAEKILEYHEKIPAGWPLQGTSGYEFLALVNKVLTSNEGANRIADFYKKFTGIKQNFEDIVYEKKHYFLYDQMQGELDNLSRLLSGLDSTGENEKSAGSLRKALGAFIAAFPVYRIYPNYFPLPEEALLYVDKAYQRALQNEPALGVELMFIKDLFAQTGTDVNEQKLHFLKRLLQYTGALAAKGVEDTSFYVYNPLISHNEVGETPVTLSIPAEEFHQRMIGRQQEMPYSLNATSTHDSKRGEDARIRINALAAFPEEWIQLVQLWHDDNSLFRKTLQDKTVPSLNDEYFIYQSLIGSYPETFSHDEQFLERTAKFIIKALREAKTNTTYSNPDTAYEETCVAFIRSILKPDASFFSSFIAFLKRVTSYAMNYSIAETVLKISTPGIPDFYQGCELWNLSYVDPDNRREVDYVTREKILGEIVAQESFASLSAFINITQNKGVGKLFIIRRLLALRAKYADVFTKGAYIPVQVTGAGRQSVLAFLRSYKQHFILVIIALPTKHTIKTDWSSLSLQFPEGLSQRWKNVFNGEIVEIKDHLPASLFDLFNGVVLENIPS